MNRLAPFVLFAISLMCLSSAPAMLSADTGISTCQIFTEDDSGRGKNKETDKKGGGKEEEEPDCD